MSYEYYTFIMKTCYQWKLFRIMIFIVTYIVKAPVTTKIEEQEQTPQVAGKININISYGKYK